MQELLLRCLAGTCAFSLACAAQQSPKHPAEQAAAEFERLRIEGDTAAIHRRLAPADSLVAARHHRAMDLARINYFGVLQGRLDSVRLHRESADTAIVVAYLKAADWRRFTDRLLARVPENSPTDAAQRTIRREIESAPRSSVVDTVRLLRASDGWRIVLHLADVVLLDSADRQLWEAYLHESLDSADAPAKTIVDIARRARHLVGDTLLAHALEIPKARALAPMITAHLRVRETARNGFIEGTVENRSGQDINTLALDIYVDGDLATSVTVRGLRAGERRRVSDEVVNLSGGLITRAVVGWMSLSAWD